MLLAKGHVSLHGKPCGSAGGGDFLAELCSEEVGWSQNLVPKHRDAGGPRHQHGQV